jgi:hypothetical protein
MKISSSAFAGHAMIPEKYTCEGSDTVPPLSIHDVPAGAKSLVLIMDDPDVPRQFRPDGNWDHWIVWNIPPDTREIAEGKAPKGVQGKNSWGRNDYGGPCPPDKQHRYVFKLFALDIELRLPASSGKPEVLAAMEGHVVAQTEMVGVYDKRARRK